MLGSLPVASALNDALEATENALSALLASLEPGDLQGVPVLRIGRMGARLKVIGNTLSAMACNAPDSVDRTSIHCPDAMP